MHQFEAMFESKPALYLHSIEMQPAGYSAVSWNWPLTPTGAEPLEMN